MTDIRYAIYQEAEHFEAVFALGEKLVEEGALEGWQMDSEQVRMFLSNRAVLCCVAILDGAIVGMVIASLQEMFFSKKLFAFEQILYVHPDCRGLSIGTALVRMCEQWGRQNGAIELHLTQRTGIDVQRTCKQFEHLGYSVIGLVAKKELICVA